MWPSVVSGMGMLDIGAELARLQVAKSSVDVLQKERVFTQPPRSSFPIGFTRT